MIPRDNIPIEPDLACILQKCNAADREWIWRIVVERYRKTGDATSYHEMMQYAHEHDMTTPREVILKAKQWVRECIQENS